MQTHDHHAMIQGLILHVHTYDASPVPPARCHRFAQNSARSHLCSVTPTRAHTQANTQANTAHAGERV